MTPSLWQPWQTEKCSVCGSGFTAKSWNNRHTHPRDGMSDCHARCCPDPFCQASRAVAKADKAAERKLNEQSYARESGS